MFLAQLKKQNPELINFAFKLHETGEILPDTYVIDLDMIAQNTKSIVKAARDNGIELFYMTKQLGRNPVIAQTIVNAGIQQAVVVDFREAEIFMQNHLALGNVGHLVQIPRAILSKILQYGTKYITEYSFENLLALNEAAKSLNIQQKVLLKVIGEKDNIYPGQMGGFTLAELENQLPDILALSNISVSGITTFPAILFDEEKKDFQATPNMETIDAAKKSLIKFGIENPVISLPSATSTSSMPLLKSLGGTEGEPGHSLTGTTPLHAISDQPEKVAYCYLSEISHSLGEHSYFYGGGYYRRGHLRNALIKTQDKIAEAHVLSLDNSSIDYCLELDKKFRAGLPVITCSRTQIFVTRSTVALVSGLHTETQPKLVGLFDSLGKKLPEGMK